MAAKILHSLADDNPDLQKKIGCMTGIIQLFDRHHAVTGRHLSHKRLPPGISHGRLEGEFNNTVYHQQTTNEINLNRTVNEKHRISTESSRASFSSSCSSSQSWLDLGKTAQQESSSCETIFPETPYGDSVMSQGNTSPYLGRHSLDLRDVVKDSMYREARGLTVKITANDDQSVCTVKHKDSPRPGQRSKSVDGSYGVGISGKQSVPADLRESVRVLAKLQEAPWYYNEARELPKSESLAKDGSRHTISRDAPWFSYDGKEVNHLSSESRDTTKSAPRVKEMPRLSLDSTESSLWGFHSDSKPNYPFKKLEDNGSSNNEVFNLPQSLGTQKRTPSVVAKLMGLDALPDSSSASDSSLGLIKTSPVEDKDPFLRSLKSNDLNKPIRVSRSIRSSLKDPVSPRWKNPDLIMKPVASSKFPIEPVPWKQPDGSLGLQKTAFRPIKVSAKTPNSFPSVYSEIERPLKDLECKQSGKDLTALKQILEAMQAKWLIESSKEELDSNFGNQNDSEPNSSNVSQKQSGQRNLRGNHVVDSTAKGSASLRTFESPIVIVKPAKYVQKSNIHPSSVIPVDGLSGLQKVQGKGFEDSKKGSINIRATKGQSLKGSHIGSAVSTSGKKTSLQNPRSIQFSTKHQQLAKESTTNSAKSSGSLSPRLQLRKLEPEKRTRPPTPPTDLNKPRRQCNGHLIDSGSPHGKLKHKSHNSHQRDDQLSQLSNESKSANHHGDDASVQSDSNLEARIDMEFSSIEHPVDINGSQSPSEKSAKFSFSGSVQKKSTPRFSEEALAEFARVTPEHPSRVSVFNSSVLRDDEPSPVKQTPNALKGDVARNLNDSFSEHQWDSVLSSLGCGLASEINRKKLQNIEHLVQKLRRLNSSHDEASTDYIASLCENTNPDHRYISEILLASGLLLRDLGSSLTTFQLHSPGHPINPELFFVLEQTNANTLHSKEESSPLKVFHAKTDPEKIHRKLIFDAVNEILVGKLALVGASQEPWSKRNKLVPKTLSAQKLLKELCSEIEQLQAVKSECSLDDEDDDLRSILWEDVTHRSGSWTNFNTKISVVVLDVERLVFKDLVDEIVIGEAGNLRARPGRRKQLFAK